jgi:post-segregation antitoxin (ccd killing protein)
MRPQEQESEEDIMIESLNDWLRHIGAMKPVDIHPVGWIVIGVLSVLTLALGMWFQGKLIDWQDEKEARAKQKKHAQQQERELLQMFEDIMVTREHREQARVAKVNLSTGCGVARGVGHRASPPAHAAPEFRQPPVAF